MKNISFYIQESSKKENIDVKFKIWESPEKLVDWIDDNGKYQKIEYVYKNKKENIVVDFLLGRKNGYWQLWMGKDGSISYDDEPIYNFKTIKFATAINSAVDKIKEQIEKIKTDKDNWVQFYINR